MFYKICNLGAREIAQWSRALIAIVEQWGSAPITHTVNNHQIVTPVPWDKTSFSGLYRI